MIFVEKNFISTRHVIQTFPSPLIFCLVAKNKGCWKVFFIKKYGVFYECQVQGFFEILELKFHFVNEHFNISKGTKKLILMKNAKNTYLLFHFHLFLF